MKLSSVFLVAQRDYGAYLGAWGFWLSLLTAPVLIGALIFAPMLLARAEPPRALAILADSAEDAAIVTNAFTTRARADARDDIAGYLAAAAPQVSAAALEAFDRAPDRVTAISAAREAVARAAPRALAAFPNPSPRYRIVSAQNASIETLRPRLTRADADDALYGALNIRRDAAGAPTIEYWSVNLSHDEPSLIARNTMRLAMQREALGAQGLDPLEADRLAAFSPAIAQFDPRPSAGEGEVTLRQRAPFYAALALAFVLWSVVFSVANMLLNGVVEEKSNKILDTLLTSITPVEMLAGKLLGVAFVSLTLFVFWGALGGGLLAVAADRAAESWLGQIASAFLDPRLITAFFVGFVFGYLIYGAIFLALGALCDSLQEAQTLLGPVALVLAVPMMLITPAIDNPNAPIIESASWVPLFTPFLLLVRAPSGLDWSDILGMGAMMAVTAMLVLWLASRVFKAGVVDQVSIASWRGRKQKG